MVQVKDQLIFLKHYNIIALIIQLSLDQYQLLFIFIVFTFILYISLVYLLFVF
jgi:hypothetical protein